MYVLVHACAHACMHASVLDYCVYARRPPVDGLMDGFVDELMNRHVDGWMQGGHARKLMFMDKSTS